MHSNGFYRVILQKEIEEKMKSLILIDDEVATITSAVKRKLVYHDDSSEVSASDQM